MENWYKVAVRKKTINDLLKNVDLENLRFDNIFGQNFRVAMPLQQLEISEIIEKLEFGKTVSGQSYKVDLQSNTVTKKGDKRAMKAGKIILKELGQKALDAWAYYVASDKSSEFSIIVSRHPIDIIKMGDHHESCHSEEKGERFHCAVAEAISGGLVGYAVKTADLQGINLQDNEIFYDEQRDVSGVKPISRIRLTRYRDEAEEQDMVIPYAKQYGSLISGFYETVKSWARSVQPFLENLPDERNLIRFGASLPDMEDDDILNEFFNTDKYKRSSVEYEGEGGGSAFRADAWQTEVDEILENKKDQMENFSVWVNVEDDIDDGNVANVRIYVSATLTIRFDGFLQDLEDSDKKQICDIINNKSNFYVSYYDLEYEVGGSEELVIDLSITDLDVDAPAGFSSVLDDFIRFEENHFSEVRIAIMRFLIESGIIKDCLEFKNRISKMEFDNFKSIDSDDQITLSSVDIRTYSLPRYIIGTVYQDLRKQIAEEINKLVSEDSKQLYLFEHENLNLQVYPIDIHIHPNTHASVVNVVANVGFDIDDQNFSNSFSYIQILDTFFEKIEKIINKIIYDFRENYFSDAKQLSAAIILDPSIIPSLPKRILDDEFLAKKVGEAVYDRYKDSYRNIVDFVEAMGNQTHTLAQYIKNSIYNILLWKKTNDHDDFLEIINILAEKGHKEFYDMCMNDPELMPSFYSNLEEQIINEMPRSNYNFTVFLRIINKINNAEMKHSLYSLFKRILIQKNSPECVWEILHMRDFPDIVANDSEFLDFCINHLIDNQYRSAYDYDAIYNSYGFVTPIKDRAKFLAQRFSTVPSPTETNPTQET